LVAKVADGQLIAGIELAFLDANAVDPDAVRAAQVPNHDMIVNLRNTAVPAGNFARGDLNVTLLVAANEHNWLVKKDVGPFAQGHQLWRLRSHVLTIGSWTCHRKQFLPNAIPL
jgi:hypothetical protein